MNWTVLLFLLCELVSCEEDDSLHSFSSLLLQKFEQQSRAALVEEEFVKIQKNIRVRPEFPFSVLASSKKNLEDIFARRIRALRKLTTVAEAAAKSYVHDTPDADFNEPLDAFSCQREMERMNESDVRHTQQAAPGDTSGIHINIESYKCDARVRRDFAWTGSKVVEDEMRENKREDPQMAHQFIGTYSGLTRMYPRRHWLVEPSQITIDLFDPKFRPWFVNSEATPKDVVFLIDYSGSVKGPTMHLIKLTLMYVLSTLTPNDYFYGVYFNSGFGPVLDCFNNTFLPATTVNKKLFFEKLSELEEKDQAHLTPPLQFSLNVLRDNLDGNSSLFSHSRSGGHKLMMMFTDGVDEWPQAPLEEELRIRGNDPIRIFGFSMGYGTGQLSLLHWMACNTYATYAVVDSIMDVKPQSRSFLDLLNIQRAKAIENLPMEERTIGWTSLYMEAQGLGPTVTLSLPVLNYRSNLVWTGQGLAGISGIDIALSEITKFLPSGEQMYGFIVDQNGILIYHPNLKLPKTEIHCIRRSACYDATQMKSRSGAGLRVQYGFSDQRVYRLVGLIDSIPTIDMFEVEGNSSALQTLRQAVIYRHCPDEPILDGDREFYCSNLAGTPFTVVLVNSGNRQTVVHSPEVLSMEIADNPLVSYLLTRRDICGWAFDSIPSDVRFHALEGVIDCAEDISLTRSMVNTVYPWASSWPNQESVVNTTCEEMRLPAGFQPRFYVNSFVYLRGQVAIYYPMCTASAMKKVTKIFDSERTSKDASNAVQIRVLNDLIVAYRSISDKYSNRLAIVGNLWRIDYLDGLFRNWTTANSGWDERCSTEECLLVTQSGYVLASSSSRPPEHLSVLDPQLFETLDTLDMVKTKTWVDAQAECQAKRSPPWSSAANRKTTIKSVVDTVFMLLNKTFWLDLYYLFTSFIAAQPSMNGGLCRFQRIDPYERCFLRHTQYTLELNISHQIQLVDLKCPRYARVFSVPGTTLSLIEVDRACPGYKSKQHYPVEPEQLDGCAKVHLFKRRPPQQLNNYTTLDEDQTLECTSDSWRHSLNFISSFFIIIIMFFL